MTVLPASGPAGTLGYARNGMATTTMSPAAACAPVPARASGPSSRASSSSVSGPRELLSTTWCPAATLSRATVPPINSPPINPTGVMQGGNADSPPTFRARPGAWRGVDARVERSRLLYERALFDGDTGALAAADRELDAVEADLALARGRIIHGRFLQLREEDPELAREDPAELTFFGRAAELYRARGNVRGEAESLFWIGCFHQLVRRDNTAAIPLFQRSLELATGADDKATMSEALRHLGIADHAAGRLDTARQRLEESSRLRREIGLLPGVASNLVGLTYIAAAQGRRDDAMALVEEARAIAEASGAHGIMRHIEVARSQL